MNFWKLSDHKNYAIYCALATFVSFTGCKPNDGSAAYEKGEKAFGVRDFARAIREFTETTKLNPVNTDAWVMLSRANLEVGDVPAAQAAIEEAVKLSGQDVDIIELVGQISYHAKDEVKMRKAYTMLTSESFPSDIRSRGYCGLAIADMAGMVSGNVDEKCARARVNLLEALRFNGSNPSARYHLGRLYRDAFDYHEAALDQFALYAKIETQKVERVVNVQRRIIPDLKDAIARATASLPGADRRESASSAAALKQADDAWKKGSYKIARQKYQDAYKADVLSFPAVLGLAKSYEKTDATTAGQKEALKYYRKASQLRPSSREALIAAGDLAMKVNSYLIAAEAYSRAIAARPNDITAIDGLIRALQKNGDMKSAAVYQSYRDRLPKRTQAR